MSKKKKANNSSEHHQDRESNTFLLKRMFVVIGVAALGYDLFRARGFFQTTLRKFPALTQSPYINSVNQYLENKYHLIMSKEEPSPQSSCVDTSVIIDSSGYNRYNPLTWNENPLFPFNSDAAKQLDTLSLEKFAEKPFDDKNTAINALLANNDYEAVSYILNTVSKESKERLLTMVDMHENTALLLALELGAPSDVIKTLVTEKSVVIANNGITPLMLAMRGMAPAVTSAIIAAIGPDRMEQATKERDAHGNTADRWSTINRGQLLSRFSRVEMDGEKDENSCRNSFFSLSKYGFLASPINPEESQKAYKNVRLEVGTNYRGGMMPQISIRATKRNAEKLFSYATEASKEATDARRTLSQLWGQSEDKECHFWKYIAKEMQPIASQLSGTSNVERFLTNQADNRRLLGGR